MRQPVFEIRDLAIGERILDRNRCLPGHLRKKIHILPGEGFLLQSAEAQNTEDAIPADEGKKAVGLDALRCGQAALRIKQGERLASPECLVGRRGLGHNLAFLESESLAFREVEGVEAQLAAL